MASIAICPRCTSTLELPAQLEAGSQLQCPICEVEFSHASVRPRTLPEARVVESPAKSPERPPSAATGADSLSRLLRASGNWATHPAPVAAAPPADLDEEPSLAVSGAEVDADAHAAAGEQGGGREEASRLDKLLSELMTPMVEGPNSPSRTFGGAAAHAESDASEAATLTASNMEFVGSDADRREADEYDLAGDDFDDASAEEEPAEEIVADLDAPLVGHSPTDDDLDMRAAPRRRRRSSAVKTLVGIVGGGAAGILLGGYGLLWIRGVDGDLLGLSRWLPNAILPASAQSVAHDDADDRTSQAAAAKPQDSPPALAASETGDGAASVERPQEEDAASSPVKIDTEVAPATATETLRSAEEVAASAKAANDLPADPPPLAPGGVIAWPSTPIVGDLLEAKFFSLAELTTAAQTAEAALARFLAGNLARQESRPEMGHAYMDLCALAERFTLSDPADNGTAMITQHMIAKKLFRTVTGDAARREDLALIAARWLTHRERPNQGIVVVGRMTDIRPRGRWTEYDMEIKFGADRVQTTVLVDSVRCSAGEEAAVVGTIVQEPRKQIAGYDGDAESLVVAGYCYKPDEPSAESKYYVP